MKTTVQLDLLITAVSFRSACDIKRACSPTWLSPISPSISAFGTSAATESTTTISTAPDRTIVSVISNACSPLSGCDMYKLSTSTPIFFAYTGSRACSASMKPAMPPLFCTSATIWRATVVLPLDSGPYISTILPFGIPPSPNAISRLKEPVGIVSTFICALGSPNFMTAPLPYCFSICTNAASNAFIFSSFSISALLIPLYFPAHKSAGATHAPSGPLSCSMHRQRHHIWECSARMSFMTYAPIRPMCRLPNQEHPFILIPY